MHSDVHIPEKAILCILEVKIDFMQSFMQTTSRGVHLHKICPFEYIVRH